ncbi:MAG: hypothetical protein U5K77_01075 [Candidatus Saccharibacteria bacterium]|nr:hypothetical protein [Candidatus Saccharibacteria bacterium]
MRNSKFRVVIFGGSVVMLLGIITLSNPNNVPLPLLILPFLLVFFIVYQIFSSILYRWFPNISRQFRGWLAIVSAILPVLLLILQSIGQLSVRDLLITLGLLGGLTFYFKKTDLLS